MVGTFVQQQQQKQQQQQQQQQKQQQQQQQQSRGRTPTLNFQSKGEQCIQSNLIDETVHLVTALKIIFFTWEALPGQLQLDLLANVQLGGCSTGSSGSAARSAFKTAILAPLPSVTAQVSFQLQPNKLGDAIAIYNLKLSITD